MVEAGPRDSRVAEVVAACRYTERVEVARILGVDPDSDRAGAVLAVIEGLRVQLCAAEVEISLDDAHRILLAAAEGPHFSLA